MWECDLMKVGDTAYIVESNRYVKRGGDPQVFRRDVPGTFYRYGWRNTGEGSQAVCNEGRS